MGLATGLVAIVWLASAISFPLLTVSLGKDWYVLQTRTADGALETAHFNMVYRRVCTEAACVKTQLWTSRDACSNVYVYYELGAWAYMATSVALLVSITCGGSSDPEDGRDHANRATDHPVGPPLLPPSPASPLLASSEHLVAVAADRAAPPAPEDHTSNSDVRPELERLGHSYNCTRLLLVYALTVSVVAGLFGILQWHFDCLTIALRHDAADIVTQSHYSILYYCVCVLLSSNMAYTFYVGVLGA